MGPVARCGKENCSGSLASLVDAKTGEAKGHFCERCGTVFQDIDKGVGIKPKGRIDSHQAHEEEARKLREALEDLQGRLDAIEELVGEDESPLAVAIRVQVFGSSETQEVTA